MLLSKLFAFTTVTGSGQWWTHVLATLPNTRLKFIRWELKIPINKHTIKFIPIHLAKCMMPDHQFVYAQSLRNMAQRLAHLHTTMRIQYIIRATMKFYVTKLASSVLCLAFVAISLKQCIALCNGFFVHSTIRRSDNNNYTPNVNESRRQFAFETHSCPSNSSLGERAQKQCLSARQRQPLQNETSLFI